MQSNTDFRGLQCKGSQENDIHDNTLRKKCSLWYRRSLRGCSDRHRQSMDSLPRVSKPRQTRSSSLVDYSDPQRITIVLEKQDNETFGFEIQTYGLQLRDGSAVETFTFVRKVQEESTAESAGLTAGDIIVTINGVSIEGSSHHHILELIRESTNRLKIETVCGNLVKQVELERTMNRLQQTLREKLVELQALTAQETRLLRGNRRNTSSLHLSVDDSWMRAHTGLRSVASDDGDQASVFGDLSSPSPFSAASTADHFCFFSRDFPPEDSPTTPLPSSRSHRHHETLGRSSSSSLAGCSSISSRNSSSISSRISSSISSSISGSLSPFWDETKISSLFGTLPRKARRAGVRKHVFKLIPGLQVEEEM